MANFNLIKFNKKRTLKAVLMELISCQVKWEKDNVK